MVMGGAALGGAALGQWGSIYSDSITPWPSYKLEVDWDGDGDFGDAGEDMSADLLAVEYSRGRGKPSTLTGRADPGYLRATLVNIDGQYSPQNASGPLYGDLLPNKRVRFWVTTPVTSLRWTGFVKRIVPRATGSLPLVELEATGPLGIVDQARIYPLPQAADTLSGSIVNTILDEAGWPSGSAYRVVDAGDVQLSRWYVDGVFALFALRDVEDTESGFLYEDEQGRIVFEEKTKRLTGDVHTYAQAFFTDDPNAPLPYITGIEEIDPLDDIFNDVNATVQPYSVGSLAVLWTLTGETPTLAAGQSRTWWANMPAGNVFVDAWTTPVVGTDITQTGVSNGDIAVVADKFATSMKIRVTNNHGSSTATLTLVQARGTPVTAPNPTTVNGQNTASQALYGVRSYPTPGPWFRNTLEAQDKVDFIAATYGDPVIQVIAPFVANIDFPTFMRLQISNRVALAATGLLTKFGFAIDFFIESITERIQWGEGPGVHEIVYGLSQSTGYDFFVLGVSQLGGEDVLGF